MGCCCSAYGNVYSRPEIAQHQELFDALMLSQLDVGRILKSFDKIDHDRSGTIELAELLAFLDLDKTIFTRRVFQMFDEDGSGLVDFREMVLSLWNYCTLGRTTLPLFTFDLYDTDSSGELGEAELKQMVEHMYGKDFGSNLHARQLLEDVAGISVIGIAEFAEFARTHPALLFRAFQMQETIRIRILGKFFWEQFSIRRLKVSKDIYLPISNFLNIHMTKDAYERMMSMPVLPPSPKHGSSKLTVTKHFKIALANSGTHGRRARKFRAVDSEDPTSISSSASTATAASEGSDSTHLQSQRYTASGTAPASVPPSGATVAPASSRTVSTKPDPSSSRRRASMSTTASAVVGRRRSTIAPDASSLNQRTLVDALEAPSLARNVNEVLASKVKANTARRRTFER